MTESNSHECGNLPWANPEAMDEWGLCDSLYITRNMRLRGNAAFWTKRLENLRRERALHAELRAANPERFGPAQLAINQADWAERYEPVVEGFRSMFSDYAERHLEVRGTPAEIPADLMPQAAPVN